MQKKLSLFFCVLLGLGLTVSQKVLAQGFTKLQVQDKYGSSNDSNEPIQPKDISSTTPSGANNNGLNPDGTLPSGMAYFNGVDVELKDMVRQISQLTGKNFIINDKKITGNITILSDRPMTIDQIYQAFLSALEINGLTTIMTPAGLIEIVQQKDSINKPTDIHKEISQATNTDKYITQIIQLVNISANEISNVIKPMVSKSGNLIAYPTTNSLILTDSGSNIEHIMKLLKELDQEGPQQVLDIVPVIYADAKDIAEKITQIFEKEDDKTGASAIAKRRFTKPGQESMEDLPSISKVVSDERTNSILIMGNKRAIIKVRAFIAQLDRPINGAEGTIHVYYLKNAKAKDVATVLSTLVQDAQTKTTAASGKTATAAKGKTSTAAPGGAVTLEGGVKVTADEGTNSLIVVASPKDYATLVQNVIAKLDLLRPQVYLEAVIMSLNVEKSSTLGVSGLGGIINTLTGGNKFTAFGGILPMTNTALSTIAGASGGFGGGIVSSDTIDFAVGSGTDASTVSVPAVSGIIEALASDVDANVLSTPSILTLDNQEAKIQVGQEVPVPSGTTVSSGVTTFDVTREDTGIILTITPQISDNDYVKLKIEQEITSVFTSDPNLGPTLDKKAVDTTVLARNKQTIVIGGLIDDKATVSTQKVPLLGDIPVLGSLFRTRVTDKQKTNLIVFITPYIIRERKDYMVILKKKIEERNHFIDLNYGSSQKKLIRRAIEDHAQSLLEFKCYNSDGGDPCIGGASYAPVGVPVSSSSSNTSSSSLTPPQKVKYR